MKKLLRFFPLLPLLLLAACGDSSVTFYQGYAEGEWLYLSAPQPGYLETLNVARGDRAAKGGKAFTLSGEQGHAQNAGRSAALEAQVRAAEASLKFAAAQLKRQEELERQNFASVSRTDELLAARTQAAAQVRVLREQLANQTVQIPEQGEVTEIYFRPGEWVPPGQPVLSLLPDSRRRIRFFVPETRLAQVRIGQPVEAHCDGCPVPIAATVNFISAQAEYTPPVIYSQGSREKLVFRVEASPSPQDTQRLRPGLPVEVSLK